MLSAVKRYRALVARVLQRCFPRTSAHLREEDELLFRRWGTAPGKANKAATAKRKGKPAAKSKSTSEGPPRAAAKPRKAAAQGIYAAAQLKVEDAQVQAMRDRDDCAILELLSNDPN